MKIYSRLASAAVVIGALRVGSFRHIIIHSLALVTQSSPLHPVNHEETDLFLLLLLHVTVNSYGHVGTVGQPIHIIPGQD